MCTRTLMCDSGICLCVGVSLSVHLQRRVSFFVHVSAIPCAYLAAYLGVCVSVQLCVCVPICVFSMHVSYLSVCLCLCPPVYPCPYLRVHLWASVPLHLLILLPMQLCWERVD